MATQNNTVTEISADGVIERELTVEEYADIKAEQDRLAQVKADADAKVSDKAAAKAAIAERLGLTEAELAILLG